MNLTAGNMNRLPFIYDVRRKSNIDEVVKYNIEISKCDWDNYETSWNFKRHPLISVISRNRALFDDTADINLAECYTCWENECNERFNQLKANEEELNRIFIDIYGLQDELTPEVEDKDVTVRKADLQRDIKSLVSYAVGCMFGRYSLDEEGLVLVGQPFEAHFFEASAPVCGTGFAGAPGASVPIGEFYYKTDEGVKKCTYNPDKDNIIPICDEEYFSDDIVSRFCELVKIVYGEKSLETNLDFIAKALGNKGNTSREVIRNYFLNDFFKDHCNTYSVTGSGKRPIYWLFDSGKQNGFKALIYMHRYDADTVGRVRTDYLHKAQKYVETAMQSAQYTIDNATSASEKSKANISKTTMLMQVAVCQMTEAEYNRTIDIVGLLIKTMDNGAKSTNTIMADGSSMSATNEQPAYTSSDIKEYSDALRREIHYLKQGKGKKYKIVNGNKLVKSDKGIYTYLFEMETELHLPDDAPVVVEAAGGLRAVGSVLSCEDFQILLLLDRDLNDKVSSAYLMVEPWKLLEALGKKMNSLNPNINKLAIKIMEEGPDLSTDTDIANVPKGQPAVEHKLETDDIVTVWGPPGTGKTYTMAKIANSYIAQGKSVLIVSHSNVSVDGVIKQVVKMLGTDKQSVLEDGKILRFGYVRDDELSQNPYATSFNYALSKCDSYAQKESLNEKEESFVNK